MKREIDAFVRGVIVEGVADGSLVAPDPWLASFTLTGALNWIGRWYEPNGVRPAREIAEGMVATLMRGLTPRKAN